MPIPRYPSVRSGGGKPNSRHIKEQTDESPNPTAVD
jgi:hypothetical protein